MATDATWSALADPHRRALLDALRERAHAVGELVERLGLSQPQASKHLRVLRDAGLVEVERRAQRRVYSVRSGPIADVDAWIGPYRELWNDPLDRLGTHLDATAGGLAAPERRPASGGIGMTRAAGLGGVADTRGDARTDAGGVDHHRDHEEHA
ncbi:ArsR/SmtB family transcription factor [Patulibacter minatonensis]|uniref:ArsR/SmtB family transcription factor n=1 Tax=Patulibacter minatonensis TaxID=298163 RepID=UPI0009FFCC4A|nr:metalloregulator ArsR/SmtB family transcription factor [Patulibacter minatonensis]